MPSLKKMDGMKLDFTDVNCFLLLEMGFLNSLKGKNICFNSKPFSKRKCTIKDVQNSQKKLVDFHIEVNKKIDNIIEEKDIKGIRQVPRSELDQTLSSVVEIRSPWNKNLELPEFDPEIQRRGEWVEAEKDNDINNTLFGEKTEKSVEGLGRIKVRKKEETKNNGFTKTKKELEETREELERRKKELEEMERIAKEKEEELKRKAEEKKKKEKEKEIEAKRKEKESKEKEKEQIKKQKEKEKQKKIEAKLYLKEQKLKEKDKKKRQKEKEKQEKIKEIERLKLEKEKEKLKKIEAKKIKDQQKMKERKKKEAKKPEKKSKEKVEEDSGIIEQDKKEIDANWDDEVRQAFTIIDNLLENLPEEKIDEFVNSKDFEIYERVVSRYKKKRE